MATTKRALAHLSNAPKIDNSRRLAVVLVIQMFSFVAKETAFKQDIERKDEEGAPTPTLAALLRLRWHGSSKILLTSASSLSTISMDVTGDYKTAEQRSYHASRPLSQT